MVFMHSSSPGAEKKQGCVAERQQEEGSLQAKASPEPEASGTVWGSERLSSVRALLQIHPPH